MAKSKMKTKSSSKKPPRLNVNLLNEIIDILRKEGGLSEKKVRNLFKDNNKLPRGCHYRKGYRGPKDLNKPKKPANSYIRWMKDARKKLTKKGPEVNKILGKRWKTISEKKKKKYVDAYKKDRKKYEKDMDEYYKKNPEKIPKSRRKVDPNKPKKPLNSYFRFTAEMRKKHEGISRKEITEKWHSLSKKAKAKYKKASQKEMKVYNKNNEKYKKDNQKKVSQKEKKKRKRKNNEKYEKMSTTRAFIATPLGLATACTVAGTDPSLARDALKAMQNMPKDDDDPRMRELFAMRARAIAIQTKQCRSREDNKKRKKLHEKDNQKKRKKLHENEKGKPKEKNGSTKPMSGYQLWYDANYVYYQNSLKELTEYEFENKMLDIWAHLDEKTRTQWNLCSLNNMRTFP
jgi:hypothetical protein